MGDQHLAGAMAHFHKTSKCGCYFKKYPLKYDDLFTFTSNDHRKHKVILRPDVTRAKALAEISKGRPYKPALSASVSLPHGKGRREIQEGSAKMYMPGKLSADQNCWAVICSEPDAPGVWETWVKERCVALGWPPSEYHLHGGPRTSSWAKARLRAQKVRPGDIIIPFLRNHTFGVPGIVKGIAIRDKEWNPTVPKGGFARNRAESELGRRIEVEWLKKGVPPLEKVAVMPLSIRGPYGEVRASIEHVRPKRYARFRRIIGDPRNLEEISETASRCAEAN